jgi:hypothetical protein
MVLAADKVQVMGSQAQANCCPDFRGQAGVVEAGEEAHCADTDFRDGAFGALAM